MKLIMENWRRYLKEEQPVSKCVSVGQHMKALAGFQKDERNAELLQQTKELGIEAAKLVAGELPFLGTAISAADYALTLKDLVSKKPVELDDLDDFPVLKKLKIDPNLVKVVEDDILAAVDEKYMDLLKGVRPETCIDKIPDINHFIRLHIRGLTDKHVVINDESGNTTE